MLRIKRFESILHVELISKVHVSSYYRRLIFHAAKATLETIPEGILRAFLVRGMSYELSLSLVSKSLIRKLNRQYRHKDKPTDVLSFSLMQNPADRHVGDVMVCLEVAKDQARAHGVCLGEELQRLFVHGILHLFGYDHETNSRDAQKMFRLQNKVVKRCVDTFYH